MTDTRTGIDFEFLSTPSARRATCPGRSLGRPCTHFYPRPPRGGRQRVAVRRGDMSQISIHALREEGDQRKARL